MNTHVPPTPIAPAPADDPAAAAARHAARLERLFRHTLREGGVNPLMHLVPRRREGSKS